MQPHRQTYRSFADMPPPQPRPMDGHDMVRILCDLDAIALSEFGSVEQFLIDKSTNCSGCKTAADDFGRYCAWCNEHCLAAFELSTFTSILQAIIADTQRRKAQPQSPTLKSGQALHAVYATNPAQEHQEWHNEVFGVHLASKG